VLVSADADLSPVLMGIEHHVILPPLFKRRFETPLSLLAAPALRRVLQTCDLVHCTVELYAPLVAAACPPGLPFVLTGHGTWAIRPLETFPQRWFFRRALRRVDRLVVQSRFTRDWMARITDLPPHAVLSGGVHPADFEQPSTVDLPVWAEHGPVVLTVGGIKPRKGQDVSLEAVIQAREAIPDLHYVVIGRVDNPALAANLAQRIDSLGLTDAIHLLGAVTFPELVAWYQRADVFLLLPVTQGSSFEGLGLVYLEAGAAGTPSIGTRGCGAEEAILDGETGLLVDQRDPVSAAAALVRLLQDDDLRTRLGAAARQRAHDLSWAALVERLAALYDDLLRERG
jgi:phosphatidylinositol alpha-1,6-mannosyltransferase